MVGPKAGETIVIKQKNATDITVELADYIEILGSSVRLTILKMLMVEPMDIQYISHCLYEKGITSTRENTKNHIDKLLKIGLVVRQTGERDSRAVMQYALVPGSLEGAIRTLSRVMKMDLTLELISQAQDVKAKIGEELLQGFVTVKVPSGADDGHVFYPGKYEVRIGRVDIENQDKYDPKNDIVLSDSYGVVTRVSKPHARLLLEGDHWCVEHREGVNGTHLWERKLSKNKKEPLKHGDIITLAEGAKSVRLVFEFPKIKNKKSASTPK
jgi:pSer/pThr/pTyr-binding forkhead associated (FHA) protein